MKEEIKLYKNMRIQSYPPKSKVNKIYKQNKKRIIKMWIQKSKNNQQSN